MRQLQNSALVWIMAVMLAGCISMGPQADSLEGKLLITDNGYEAVVDTATLYVQEGRMSPSQIEQAKTIFDNYEAARTIAVAAVEAGNAGEFNTQNGKMLSITSALRLLLTEIE